MFRHHAHPHSRRRHGSTPHRHLDLTDDQKKDLAYQVRWHLDHVVNQHILGHSPVQVDDDTPLTDDTVLCRCRQVDVKAVKQAIAGGATTVQAVIAQTSLGQGCKHCLTTVEPIIEKLLAEK